MTRRLTLPLSVQDAHSLRAGDAVELSGSVLTGRDLACARLFRLLKESKPLPVELAGETIYFVGPSPARPGEVIGSAGPTTSARMNPFIPALLESGLSGIIGKGFVANEVKSSLQRHGGVYFGAIGGTGALLSACIAASEVLAFPELLSEAIHRLLLVDFPAIVLHDTQGGDVYERTYGDLNEDKTH